MFELPLFPGKNLRTYDAECQCSMPPDCRSRSTSLEIPSCAACAASKWRRRRMYRAMATHTTTTVLTPTIRNHQIILTTDEDNRSSGRESGKSRGDACARDGS